LHGSVMIKVDYNDGGRRAAGFPPGKGGDCVARSIAIASGRPYGEVYAALARLNEGMRKTSRRTPTVGQFTADKGIYTSSAAFKRYMRGLGFVWTSTMSIGSGCRVHLRADELPRGRLVVKISRHYSAVIDGVLHDTHDASRGGTRCVYGYWRLP
jgi:hypothetical protein